VFKLKKEKEGRYADKPSAVVAGKVVGGWVVLRLRGWVEC